jgi:transcriptional regulator with XRE-family HTH domain
MMEWGASRILALRKHASMTQAQFAQWLGVSIKQVKYLEHQRRNPSGPTRRLLGILALQLGFEGGAVIQVLGASTSHTQLPARPSKKKTSPPQNSPTENAVALTITAPTTEAITLDQNAPGPVTNDEAFVWL